MLFLRYYLWIAPHVLLSIFLILMWYRGLHRQLPTLASYAIFGMFFFLTSLTLAFLHPFSRVAYQWVIAVGNAMNIIFVLCVIYELTKLLIFSRFSFLPALRAIFGGVLLALIFVTAAIAGTLSDVGVLSARNLFHVIDFSSGLMQVGMLLTLFILSRTLQISWRNFATGIVLGFGVSASIQLVGAALRNYFGSRSLIAVDIVEMSGFHVCVVIWLVYVLLPERTGPSGKGLGKQELESWNRELERMVRN